MASESETAVKWAEAYHTPVAGPCWLPERDACSDSREATTSLETTHTRIQENFNVLSCLAHSTLAL